MLDPEGVIDLLNDFPESFDDVDGESARKIVGSEIFFSSDGQPTDAFLEALKKDWNLLPSTQVSNDPTKLFNKRNVKVKATNRPVSNNEAESERRHRRPSSLERGRKRDIEITSESGDSSIHDFIIRQPIKRRSPRESSPVILKKKKHQKQKKEKKTTANTTIATNNTVKESASSALINSILTAEEVEQDAVRKSLQLRVAGQLNCIKLLQTKLKQSLTALQQRDTRLVQLEAKFKIAQEAAASKALDIRQQKELQGAYETIDRLKKQLQQTEDKLQEETARRLRSEERGRSWKEQADKHKARSSELEQKQTVDQNELTKQLTSTKKYKSAAKELAAELAALRAAQERNLHEAKRRNQTVELAQQRANEAQLQADRLREEVKQLSIELHIEKNDKRELVLQLQVAREKQALMTTEHRLQQRMRDPKSSSSLRESSSSRRQSLSTEPQSNSQRHSSSTHSRKIGYRIDHNVYRSDHMDHLSDDVPAPASQFSGSAIDHAGEGLHSITIQHIREIAQGSLKAPVVTHNVSPQETSHVSHRVISSSSAIPVEDHHAHSDNGSVTTTESRLAKIYSKLSGKGNGSSM